jgi:hypothetical protein
MKKRNQVLRNTLTVLVALALSAAVSPAQQAAPSAAKAAVKAPIATQADARQEKETQAQPNEPGKQGVKVHGHWKIDIKNPDGTLDRTVEFENSLVTGGDGGDFILSQLLTGKTEMGDWGIDFQDSTGSWCPNYCLIDQVAGKGALGSNAATFTTPAEIYSGLTASFVDATQQNGEKISMVIQGSAVASTNTSIINVGTMAGYCVINPTASTKANATACATGTDFSMFTKVNSTYFTGVNLSPAITVVSGQTVLFTVTITFS